METDKGYIVAMHNHTKKIVVIGLEMWELIENINDYKPLHRADSKTEAYSYIKEISSDIQKETTMINKHEFIEKACGILNEMLYLKDCGDYYCVASAYEYVKDFIDSFKEYMEE